MQLIFEILPVFLFFIAFKFNGIYVATVVGIVSTLAQVIVTKLITGKWDQKQYITFFVFLFFGSMTLYFHNPIFIKWKPTIVFWIFTLIILVTHFFTAKPLMQRLMENVLQDKAHIPAVAFRRLNIVWGLFFFTMGVVNLYIAYYMSNDMWVNFKFYGITAALLAISVVQALYLARYAIEESK